MKIKHMIIDGIMALSVWNRFTVCQVIDHDPVLFDYHVLPTYLRIPILLLQSADSAVQTLH